MNNRLEVEEGYLEIVQLKLNSGNTCLKENGIISGMSIKKAWLTGLGLWLLKREWDGRITKEFFPYTSEMYDTAKTALKTLIKKLF